MLKTKSSTTDEVTLLALDPGLTNAGWVVSVYNFKTKDLHIKAMGLIHGNNYAELKAQEKAVLQYGKRLISLVAIRQVFSQLYETYQPDYVISENAFFNRFRPSAFVALNDFINTVRSVLYFRYDTPLYLISPKSIKRAVCVGDADKNDVAAGVKANKHIIFDIESIPDIEHTWDACGGSYAFVQLYLERVLEAMPYDVIISSQKVSKKK